MMETSPTAAPATSSTSVEAEPQDADTSPSDAAVSLDSRDPVSNDISSPDVPSAATLAKRSKKRKSILPENFRTIRASLAAYPPSPEGNSPTETPERSVSSERDSTVEAAALASAALPGDFSSNLTEPIAKRLRTRGGEKPAYFKAPRNKKARSVSEEKAPSLSPADSPLSDCNFIGTRGKSNILSDAAVSQELPESTLKAEHVSLKSILKHGHAPSAKHLAFLDEGVEERQALAESRRVEVESVPAAAAPSSQKGVGLIPGRIPTVQILSWNIAGLRAFIEKHTWTEINTLLPDIICLQETKVQSNDLFEQLGVDVGAVHAYWHHSVTKGHAGVAILSKVKPLRVIYGLPRSDDRTFGGKGHVITAEYPGFFLVNTYVPNSSALLKNLEERLEWDKDFRVFLVDLQAKKPVIVAGDLNCALKPVDLANPTKNVKNPGFTPRERESLALTMEQLKIVDVFRHLNPDTAGCYTFWSTRTRSRPKNIGWRLDYFLASESLWPNVCGIRHFVDVLGSDHCPLMLYLDGILVPDIAT